MQIGAPRDLSQTDVRYPPHIDLPCGPAVLGWTKQIRGGPAEMDPRQ